MQGEKPHKCDLCAKTCYCDFEGTWFLDKLDYTYDFLRFCVWLNFYRSAGAPTAARHVMKYLRERAVRRVGLGLYGCESCVWLYG